MRYFNLKLCARRSGTVSCQGRVDFGIWSLTTRPHLSPPQFSTACQHHNAARNVRNKATWKNALNVKVLLTVYVSFPPYMVKSKHNFDRHPSPKNANSPTGNLIRGAAILQTDSMDLRIPKTPMPSSSLRIAAIFSSTTPYRAT